VAFAAVDRGLTAGLRYRWACTWPRSIAPSGNGLERLLHTGPATGKQYLSPCSPVTSEPLPLASLCWPLQPEFAAQPGARQEGQRCWPPAPSFNTAASFLTNTTSRHYSGEKHLSYFSQLFVIGWKQSLTRHRPGRSAADRPSRG